MKKEGIWSMEKRIPLLNQLHNYTFETAISDLVAGITVTFTLIPQGIAYAALAGTPPIYGLYTGSLPLYIYALFGTSRHLIHGPFAVTCFMLGEIGTRYSNIFEKGSQEYTEFVLYISFIAGLLFWVALYFRLGYLTTLVTPSVTTGFITGCGLLVFLHQLPPACGFKIGTYKHSIDTILAVARELPNSSGIALCISVPSYVFGLMVKYHKQWRESSLTKQQKESTPGRVMSFLLNCSVTFVFVCGYLVSKNLKVNHPESEAAKALEIVGEVPSGFQATQFKPSAIPWQVALSAIPDALTLALVSCMTGWSISRKFAEKFNYDVEINQELFSYGLVNVVGSTLLNSFFNAGGLARTAVGVSSGAKTQVSNIIAGTFVTVAVLFLSQEVYYIPHPTLGAITLSAIAGLIDFPGLLKSYKSDKKEAAVMLVTTMCTVALGVATGVLLGIVISLFSELYSNCYPRVVELGLVSPSDLIGDSDIEHENEDGMVFIMGGRSIPRMTIVRVDATSLYFGNAHYVRDLLTRIFARAHRYTHYFSSSYRKTKLVVSTKDLKVFVIDLSTVTTIDDTAAIMLNEFANEMKKENVIIAYVQGSSLYDQLYSTHVETKEGNQKETDAHDNTRGVRRRRSNSHGSDVSDTRSSSGRSSGYNRESLTYRMSILSSGPVAANQSRFSTGPHVTKQLIKAGANKESSQDKPTITLFASVPEAVKYFTVQIYLDCCLSYPKVQVPTEDTPESSYVNPLHSLGLQKPKSEEAVL